MFITNTQNSNRDATEKGSLINGFWGQTAWFTDQFYHLFVVAVQSLNHVWNFITYDMRKVLLFSLM